MIKVSVIIPVYNAANTIERCVESIIKNQEKNIEIILVEDNSKDESRICCEKLSEKYENVRCLYNERNRGVSFTRNRGLEAANGQYLMFVDSDDWVDVNYIHEFLEIIEKEPQFVVCGYINHDEKMNGSVEYVEWKDFVSTEKSSIKSVVKELYDCRLLQQLWNKIFLAEVVKNHHIRFDESISIGEDFRFILTYIRCSKIEKVSYINKSLYHYMRDQEGSLMHNVGYESIEEPLKNLKSMYQIMGVSSAQMDKKMVEERKKQIELYAYLIFHNVGMKQNEKKRLILALDSEQGHELYRRNKRLYLKERIMIALKKMTK